jgi:AcrR family transcriptional regulator
MNSNKSRPTKKRIALEPQRSHGKLRVAALLEAGASVIAKKGFQAATMAEIASVAGAPIGSLYRFFPNKEILADALIQRFCGRIDEAFVNINGRVMTMSMAELTDAFLGLLVELHAERLAIRALLEAHSEWSAKREEFRHGVRGRIARTLLLRSPNLRRETAESMAVVLLHNMKTANAINAELTGKARSSAARELHEMIKIYLAAKLRTP